MQETTIDLQELLERLERQEVLIRQIRDVVFDLRDRDRTTFLDFGDENDEVD